MNLQRNFYIITDGSPWHEAARSECRRYRAWKQNVGVVMKDLEKQLGFKVASLLCDIFERRVQCSGIGLESKPKDFDPAKLGLKKTNSPLLWHFRANKAGEALGSITAALETTPFCDFFGEMKEFPYAEEFINTERGLIFYRPKAHHSHKGKLRTIVALAHDADVDLQPRDLPAGVHQVASKDANAWLAGKSIKIVHVA